MKKLIQCDMDMMISSVEYSVILGFVSREELLGDELEAEIICHIHSILPVL